MLLLNPIEKFKIAILHINRPQVDCINISYMTLNEMKLKIIHLFIQFSFSPSSRVMDEIELYDLFACNQDNLIQCAQNAQDLMVAESSTPEMALEFLDILCGPRKISLGYMLSEIPAPAKHYQTTTTKHY